MLLISQVEESLIQSSRITVTFYRKKKTPKQKQKQFKKVVKD